MRLLQIAARVAAHVYRVHWAARSDVLRVVDEVFHNAEVYPPRMKEVTGEPDTYEGEIDEGFILRVKGTDRDDITIELNGKPIEDMDAAVDQFVKLRAERGIEVKIAPFRGHAQNIEYDLRKYNYDHPRSAEELEVSWSDRSGNKVELAATTSSTGTSFTKVMVNGMDATQAASDGNWDEVGKYFKLSGADAFDLMEHVFKPASLAVEDSAEQNAGELERWTTGLGTFFDWVKGEGYSIKDGMLQVTGTGDEL